MGAQGRCEGRVVSVKRCWWLKVNTKPMRGSALDGARFPHRVTVRYTVGGRTYQKTQYIPWQTAPPAQGQGVSVWFEEEKPSRMRAEW